VIVCYSLFAFVININQLASLFLKYQKEVTGSIRHIKG